MTAGSAGVSPATEPNRRGWHSRGYLPHFDQPGLLQIVTFRLADAVPQGKLDELNRRFSDARNPKWRKGLEEHMDAGHGACHLRDTSLATIVEGALTFFDGTRYRLLAWVVMPNHVHVVIEVLPGFTLSGIVGSWKGFTSKEINKRLSRTGRLWQPESFDRMIRDESHLASAIEYLHQNPVKAGLASSPQDWPFGSAKAGETPALPAGGYLIGDTFATINTSALGKDPIS